MRRPPNRTQQAVAGLAVLLTIAATLMGGVILALGDGTRPGDVADTGPTPTTISLPTLPPDDQTPTRTPTADRTEPPTATERATRTAAPRRTPTETRTPAPTSTRTLVPTPTTRATNTARPPTQIACMPRNDWAVYTVQSGETLFRVGLKFGLTTTALAQANCLNSTNIYAGQQLRVPPVTPHVTNTEAPEIPPGDPSTITPTGTQTTTDGACTNSESIITAPRVGATLTGIAEFRGTATLPDFSFYKLEVRQEGASTAADYVTFHTGAAPVSGGLLGTLNTALYENGEYWIRLVVVNTTNNYPERCAILYIFQN